MSKDLLSLSTPTTHSPATTDDKGKDESDPAATPTDQQEKEGEIEEDIAPQQGKNEGQHTVIAGNDKGEEENNQKKKTHKQNKSFKKILQ